MAFDKTPTTWLANWSEDGTNITVPLATFPEMTAAEADASTGDIRYILFAICDELFTQWNATATADRPTQMTISKSVYDDTANDERHQTFSFKFITEVSGQEVKDES